MTATAKQQYDTWQDLKATILVRDRNRCVYCGFQGGRDDENLTVDHIIPVVAGGRNRPRNLAAACLNCNRLKADFVPTNLRVKKLPLSGRRPLAEYRLIYEQAILPKLRKRVWGKIFRVNFFKESVVSELAMPSETLLPQGGKPEAYSKSSSNSEVNNG